MFASFILLEVLLYIFKYKKDYPYKEGMVAVAIVTVGNLITPYVKPYTHAINLWFHNQRFMDFPLTNIGHYLVLFLIFEFIYYWQHRFDHKIRFFWLDHSVHHAITKMCLMTGLQKGWMRFFVGAWIPWTLLYFMGVDANIIWALILGTSVYQFFLHTEIVPSLGWLELIFNTPSNHRVHHSQNELYVDKNFGGTLIIFDRIFGTYQAEVLQEPCRYGIINTAPTLNPLAIVYNVWISFFIDMANWCKNRMKISDSRF